MEHLSSLRYHGRDFPRSACILSAQDSSVLQQYGVDVLGMGFAWMIQQNVVQKRPIQASASGPWLGLGLCSGAMEGLVRLPT